MRGSLAELGELRTIILDLEGQRQLMQMELEDNGDAYDEFGDAEQNDFAAGIPNESQQKDSVDESTSEDINKSTKRSREEGDSDQDDEEDSFDEPDETLLLYLPSIQCTCSSWNMKNIAGDLFVTSLRILFIASDNSESDDVAIDGRCIALHAVDSNDEDHDTLCQVYCQLSDPGCESSDVYNSGIGMIGSANIMDDNDNQSESGDEIQEGNDDDVSDDNEIMEVYFKPMICEHVPDKEQHAETCQRLFASLTKLASLNPTDDDDGGFGGGGGLFNMLSLMAGMGNVLDGDGSNDADEMVIRDNNFVEADEESEVAPEDERQAMLDRLDAVLVVPPEYEIQSEEEGAGQFEDAEEDDHLL